jgi:hypothetical protein
MWLRWSGLSRCRPSQQSGKFTCSSRYVLASFSNVAGTSGHVGHFLLFA